MDDEDGLFTGEYAEDFQIWAGFYDSGPEVAAVRGAVDVEGADVLEVGAGTGRLTQYLAPEAGTYRAVDIDEELVEYCQDEHDDLPASFEQQDSLDLELGDDSVDVLIDSWAFCCYPSPDQATAEFDRVLREDGRLVVIREVPDSEYERVLSEFVPADREYSVADQIDDPLRERFGEPVETAEIGSDYVFDSVADATEAFRFHLEEWSDCDLADDQLAELRSMMEQRERDGEVHVDEQAYMMVFDA